MRDVAAWLVARPQNAVMVLSISVLIPILQPLGGVVLVFLVVAKGQSVALRYAAIAAALTSLVMVISGVSVAAILPIFAISWLPLYLLALLLQASKSFVLTVQASVIVATLAGLATGILIADPVVFWQHLIDVWLELVGQTANEGSVVRSPEFAANLGAMFVASSWLIYMLIFLMGYLLYGKYNDGVGTFGRIRDLNFGRVLALSLVLAVVLSAITGSILFDLAAIVLFASFLLQGWALAYWVFAENGWPMGGYFAVCVVSVVIGFLSAVLMMIGYLDAWFDIRRRFKKSKGSKT